MFSNPENAKKCKTMPDKDLMLLTLIMQNAEHGA